MYFVLQLKAAATCLFSPYSVRATLCRRVQVVTTHPIQHAGTHQRKPVHSRRSAGVRAAIHAGNTATAAGTETRPDALAARMLTAWALPQPGVDRRGSTHTTLQ